MRSLIKAIAVTAHEEPEGPVVEEPRKQGRPRCDSSPSYSGKGQRSEQHWESSQKGAMGQNEVVAKNQEPSLDMSLAVPQGSPRGRVGHAQGRLLSWALGRAMPWAHKENQGGVAGLLAHSLLRQLCALSMACSTSRSCNLLQAPETNRHGGFVPPTGLQGFWGSRGWQRTLLH